MKIFIYHNFTTFLLIFSILSLTAVTQLWWLSLISIIFFIWNILNEKKRLSVCLTFLTLTFLLIIFNFTVIKPSLQWGNRVQAEWEKTGYDSAWLGNAQEQINVIDRSIEDYRLKFGTYPQSLSDVNEIYINNRDYSYRIKEVGGYINGVPFYYEKVGFNMFYLAGVGKDGTIKTNDDLLPQISKENEETTGLVKYVIKSFTPEEMEREKKVIEMYKKTKRIEKLFKIKY